MNIDFRILRRRWYALAGFHILLLIHLTLYLISPNRGNSISFRLLAFAMGGFAIGVIGLAWWLTERRLDSLRNRCARWRYLMAGVGIVALGILGFGIRPEWIYAHMALAVAASCSLAYLSLNDNKTPLPYPRLWLALGASLVVGIIFLRIYSLSHYPSLHVDEPWTLSWAVNHVRTGQVSDRIMLNFNGDPRYDIPRFYVALALWLRVFNIGLWEGRLFSFALILLLISLTALATRNLYGKQAAWFTAATLFASVILMSAARIRHDIGLAVTLAASLWLFTEAINREKYRYHFLAGAIAGFGLFSHYNAIVLGPVLAIGLYGPRYIGRVRQGNWHPNRSLWLFVGGGLLAAGIVVSIQILPDIDAFLLNRQSRTPATIEQFLNSFWFYIQNVYAFSMLEFALIGLGIALALWRRRAEDLSLVIIVFLGHIALGLVITVAKAEYYIIPMTPFYAILVARLFTSKSEESQVPNRILIERVVFILFFSVNLTFSISRPLNTLLKGQPVRLAPPNEAQWILDNVEPGKTVMGVNYYYLWLTDYRYASPHIPFRILPEKRAEFPSNEALWDAIGIDVFIDNPGLMANDLVEAVRDSGYLESRGFNTVAEFPHRQYTSTIYQQQEMPIP